MRKISLLLVAMLLFSVLGAGSITAAGDVTVVSAVADCGETTFTATNTTSVSNIYLIVEVDGVVQYQNVPNDGLSYSITVGPFYENKTIYWRVFGGAERDYDQPLWNGYGTPTFRTDIANYADSVGSYNWVIGGTNDPNPFVTWNTLDVEGCALTKDQCKDYGWMNLGFTNQGLCIKYVNEQLHDK